MPTGVHRLKLEVQPDLTNMVRIGRQGYQRNAILHSRKDMSMLPPGSVSLFVDFASFDNLEEDPEAVSIMEDYMTELYDRGYFTGSKKVLLDVRQSLHFKIATTEEDYLREMEFLRSMTMDELEDYAAE